MTVAATGGEAGAGRGTRAGAGLGTIGGVIRGGVGLAVAVGAGTRYSHCAAASISGISSGGCEEAALPQPLAELAAAQALVITIS